MLDNSKDVKQPFRAFKGIFTAMIRFLWKHRKAIIRWAYLIASLLKKFL